MATDEERAAELERLTREKGIYGATEDGDNSLATSHLGFVGVSEEYRNAANPLDLPMTSPEEGAAVTRAHRYAKEMVVTTATPQHPSTPPVDDHVAAIRALDKAILGNKEEKNTSETTAAAPLPPLLPPKA